MTDRLVDVDRKKRTRWTGGHDIVLVRRDACLRCGFVAEVTEVNPRTWATGAQEFAS